MKLETAIDLLECCKRDDFAGYCEVGENIQSDIKKAHDLGIAALKRLMALRRPDPPFKTAEEALPGETEE